MIEKTNLIRNHWRDAGDLSAPVGAGVNGITLRQEISSVFIPDEIGKFHAGPFQIFNICFNQDNIIVMCRQKIVAVHLRKGQIEAGRLNLLVLDVHVTEKLITAYFEPADIIGMIDDTHGIGIRIDDPDPNGCLFQ